MKVLGVNLGINQNNRVLRDGGACVMIDGRIAIAIAEERITRTKTDSGFGHSVPYCLDYLGLKLADLDAVVVSSCLDTTRFDKDIWGFLGVEQNKLHYVSHHLSHAYSSFMISPFDEAIIIVMDSGGNILDDNEVVLEEWWKHRREQNSYYVGRGNNITLIGRDFDEPFAVGFGEAYRAFTYYLGWHSYIHSGKTMALSIFGDPKRFEGVELFETTGNRLFSLIQNDPLNPIEMIQRFGHQRGVNFGRPRNPAEQIEDIHRDIAYLIQDRMERALINKVTTLSNLTGIKKLCLAGGVALNCVVNSKILSSTPIESLFIVPAAGDTGQCLGNALYGYYGILGGSGRPEKFSPYLGKEYANYKQVAAEWFHASGVDWELVEVDNYLQTVAELISKGFLIAWFSGRSEFGPRALGARSILADPRYQTARRRLLKTKEREDFMPFAPAILREHAQEYFNPPVDSPYMLLTADAKSYKKWLIPGVLHARQNSRLQTVSSEDNPVFHQLLQEYMKMTGLPVVINTSFNKRGSPIVESPYDALEMFRDMDLDVLVLNNLIIKKRGIDEKVIEVAAESKQHEVHNSALKEREYDLSSTTVEYLTDSLSKEFPDYQLFRKNYITLYNEYIKLLREGRKVTTIRYRPKGLHYPGGLVLPLIDTGLSGVYDGAGEHAGKVEIVQFLVKPFGWLNDEDAKKDGFADEEELKTALRRIYGPVNPVEYVTIYTVKLI